jgi:hypothetical protein
VSEEHQDMIDDLLPYLNREDWAKVSAVGELNKTVFVSKRSDRSIERIAFYQKADEPGIVHVDVQMKPGPFSMSDAGKKAIADQVDMQLREYLPVTVMAMVEVFDG